MASSSKYNKKFEEQIKFFIDTTNKKLYEVKELAIFQLFSDIVDNTPLYVKGSPVRGQTKWNWQISIGTWNPRVLTGTDVSGDRTKERGYTQLQKVTGNEDIYIHNSVAWINKLEYGRYDPPESDRVSGGFSTQAPSGIARIAVLKWPLIVQDSAKQVNR